jgi:uncharacterized protein
MCAVLDLRSFPLNPGQAVHVPVPLELQRFTLAGDPYDPLPAKVVGDLQITRMASGRLFDLEFETPVFGACQRCLGEARIQIEVEGQEYQDDSPELGAEDDMTTPYLTGELLDVDRWAHDALLLAMPLRVLCREECEGLCPTCGIDRNSGTCSCVETTVDDRWSALRDLL